MPGLGERDRLVELRQGEDAAGDQEVAQRAIGGRERLHGGGLFAGRAGAAAAIDPLQHEQQRDGGKHPEAADDPGAEPIERWPSHDP